MAAVSHAGLADPPQLVWEFGCRTGSASFYSTGSQSVSGETVAAQCTVVYPAGTELQATVDSLTEFTPPPRFSGICSFTFREFKDSICVFILATYGLTYRELETKTSINFAKLRSNSFKKEPLTSSPLAHIYQKEAGSDCCELFVKTAEQVKEIKNVFET